MRSLRKEARPSSRMEQHEAVEGTRLCQCFFSSHSKRSLFLSVQRRRSSNRPERFFGGEDEGLVGFLLSSHASSLCNEKRQKQKKPLRFLARA
ncbi:MAG TPA: hypothetical protein DHV46_00490 [Desulfovibrio piger]|nr:hypothetical protein [Desulfovibrio piger]